jgi:hemerythrin-like domain-containing protein
LNLKDGEITIEDLFILNHLKRQQSNEKKRMEKERKELDECTFKPNIKSSI